MGQETSRIDGLSTFDADYPDGGPHLSRGSAYVPYLVALVAQVGAVLLTGMVVRASVIWLGIGIPLAVAAILQGIFASSLGHWLGLRPWWLPIHLLFAPAVYWTLLLGVAPNWFLASFVLLFLIYWGVARTRVPLYLSSDKASRALAGLLPANPGFRMLDLGAGFGGVLADLYAKRPDGHFVGIEIAPLPFIAGWLRSKLAGRRYRLQWGNFWSHSLAPYDMVYAYLSPVPMHDLWHKAAAEMRPGSLLVSNSFPVPGVTADETLQLADFHRSQLYLYRVPPRQ